MAFFFKKLVDGKSSFLKNVVITNKLFYYKGKKIEVKTE